MGPTLAATEEGTLIEEAGSKHEDAGVAAIVGQQRGSMCGGCFLESFVISEESFQQRGTKAIFSC